MFGHFKPVDKMASVREFYLKTWEAKKLTEKGRKDVFML